MGKLRAVANADQLFLPRVQLEYRKNDIPVNPVRDEIAPLVQPADVPKRQTSVAPRTTPPETQTITVIESAESMRQSAEIIRRLIADALARKESLLPAILKQHERPLPNVILIRKGVRATDNIVVATTPDTTAIHLEQQITALRGSPDSLTPITKPLIAEYIADRIMDLARQNLDKHGTHKPFTFSLSAIESALNDNTPDSLTSAEKAIIDQMAILAQHDLAELIPEGCGLANVFDSLNRLDAICIQCLQYRRQSILRDQHPAPGIKLKA